MEILAPMASNYYIINHQMLNKKKINKEAKKSSFYFKRGDFFILWLQPNNKSKHEYNKNK